MAKTKLVTPASVSSGPFIRVTPAAAARSNNKKWMDHAEKVIKSTIENTGKLSEKLVAIDKPLSDKLKDTKKRLEENAKSEGIEAAFGDITSFNSGLDYSDPKEVRNEIAKKIKEVADNAFPNISAGKGFLQDIHALKSPFPDGVEELKEIVKEMKQFENKDKKQYSALGQYAMHRIGDLMGMKDATQQLEKLKEVAADLDTSLIFNYIKEYGRQVVVINVLQHAFDLESTDKIRTLLGDIKSTGDLEKYYPGFSSSSGTSTSSSSTPSSSTPPGGSPSAPSGAKTTAKSMSAAILNQSGSETVEHFKAQVGELENKLGMIVSKTDTKGISEANHDSIEIVKGINSMLGVFNAEEKEEIEKIVGRIHTAFRSKAEQLGLVVNLINNVGSYDLVEQDSEEAYDSFKAYMRGLLERGEIRMASSAGTPFSVKDLDEFLENENRKRQFVNAFNRRQELHKILRDRNYDAFVLKSYNTTSLGEEDKSA